MAEEVRGLTWDLDGEQLEPWLAAQRLYKAGFKDADVLCTMWAIIEAESGGYLKAWHHNVKRTEDGQILYNDANQMTVLSTDLGFIQKNVVHDPPVLIGSPEEAQAFVDNLWVQHPELARGDESAEIAYLMYKQRGYTPWYAFTNKSYMNSLGRGTVAVANYLALKHGFRPMPYVKRVVS
jgi:hypothetical protein